MIKSIHHLIHLSLIVIVFGNIVDSSMAISIGFGNIAVVEHLTPNMVRYKPILIALREFDRNHLDDKNTAIQIIKLDYVKFWKILKKSLHHYIWNNWIRAKCLTKWEIVKYINNISKTILIMNDKSKRCVS